jgi:hypothetical protein
MRLLPCGVLGVVNIYASGSALFVFWRRFPPVVWSLRELPSVIFMMMVFTWTTTAWRSVNHTFYDVVHTVEINDVSDDPSCTLFYDVHSWNQWRSVWHTILWRVHALKSNTSKTHVFVILLRRHPQYDDVEPTTRWRLPIICQRVGLYICWKRWREPTFRHFVTSTPLQHVLVGPTTRCWRLLRFSHLYP